MTTGSEAIWNSEPRMFEDMNMPTAGGFQQTGLGDVDNGVLTETEQPQPDDAEKVSYLKGDACWQTLTGVDTRSSAHLPEGPDFGCGSCAERLILATGRTTPKVRLRFPQR